MTSWSWNVWIEPGCTDCCAPDYFGTEADFETAREVSWKLATKIVEGVENPYVWTEAKIWADDKEADELTCRFKVGRVPLRSRDGHFMEIDELPFDDDFDEDCDIPF
jgi:hypothetical protein